MPASQGRPGEALEQKGEVRGIPKAIWGAAPKAQGATQQPGERRSTGPTLPLPGPAPPLPQPSAGARHQILLYKEESNRGQEGEEEWAALSLSAGRRGPE